MMISPPNDSQLAGYNYETDKPEEARAGMHFYVEKLGSWWLIRKWS